MNKKPTFKVSVPDYGELILNLNMKKIELRKYTPVSVPDYGELILNNQYVKENNAKWYMVSVPDYGELILNDKAEKYTLGTILMFPSPITGN